MTYEACKKIIESGNYTENEMMSKLDLFLLCNRITEQEYKELIDLI